MSDPAPLLGPVLARGGAAANVTDEALLRAMLDVEAGLARAQARVGLLPVATAEAIAGACDRVADKGVAQLGVDAAAVGNPVVPLVRALEREAEPLAGGHVHLGATSQDVLDSALMLISVRACQPLLADLVAAADAAASLAAQHRDAVMVARTLLQQARPTTFGLKAAGWASGLDGAVTRLLATVSSLPVQFGGAAGTRSGLSGLGGEVAAALAQELGLAAAPLPWHTMRLPVLDLGGSLGTACAITGKVGLDLVLLAQNEVGEVHEGRADRGGSSAMPHKQNPVAAISARAAALRAPGLVTTLHTAAQLHEHERAAGAWHVEWEPLRDLLSTTGSAAAWLRDSLEHLAVDRDRMRARAEQTLDRTRSEEWATALTPGLGRAAAHDLVRQTLASGQPLATLRSRVEGDAPQTGDDALKHTGDARTMVDCFLAGRTSR